jgi:hypothetical protein
MFSFQSLAKIATENLENVMKEKCASCKHNKTIKSVFFCANSQAENCFETTFDAMCKHGRCMFYERNRKE